ncbi:hypothetical protein QFZ62_002035 [Clavibacter sp. B3I6]|uniref:hypothetical protein n=1 Tax=Clavibacter sp. B3I6 TaxID=3042268 RepID=UPI00277F4771|nr:hypothetical protein [Clavibacter sp. B3I6]MDQ0744727.1 hypothetical protein [Clavibacter sp. B3I6]
MLSSPDRDDDLLRERLRALHDAWPGDPADDDPLHASRGATGITAADGSPARRSRSRLGSLLRSSCRALLARLGASATGLPLPRADAAGARRMSAQGRTRGSAAEDPRDAQEGPDPHQDGPLTRPSPPDHPPLLPDVSP